MQASTKATSTPGTLKFLTNDTNRLLQWLRFPGDMLFIIGGVLPVLWLCWLAVRYRIAPATVTPPQTGLFTEVQGVREAER
jgi:nitric oxide reductase subunit B